MERYTSKELLSDMVLCLRELDHRVQPNTCRVLGKLGTDYEQLQAALDAAQHSLAVVTENRDGLVKALDAAQAKVREYERQSDHLGVALADEVEARLAETDDLRNQLALERTRREAVEEQLRLANCDQVNTEAALNDAQEALRLVRDLVCTKSFTINGPDIRTMAGNVLYACSSPTSAERLGALLMYREATLDAAPGAITTPTTNFRQISSKPVDGVKE